MPLGKLEKFYDSRLFVESSDVLFIILINVYVNNKRQLDCLYRRRSNRLNDDIKIDMQIIFTNSRNSSSNILHIK